MWILGHLERQWYRTLQKRHQLPPLGRLWGVALHQRNRRLADRISDAELFDLVVEAVLHCVTRFNERHPPNEGLCRRGIHDRFGRKLVWQIERHAHPPYADESHMPELLMGREAANFLRLHLSNRMETRT